MQTATRQFRTLAKTYLKEVFAFFPTQATQFGFSGFDHALESYAPEVCKDLKAMLHKAASGLRKIPLRELSFSDYFDAMLMKVELDSALFNLETVEPHKRDPAIYPETVLFSAYLLIGRDLTPWKERAEALLSRFKAYGRLLQEARQNLKRPPKVFTEVALEVTQGGISFFKNLKFKSNGVSKALLKELESYRQKTANDLHQYESWLTEKLLPESTGAFAIGADRYNHMLRGEHLLPYSCDDLHAIGEEHFHRIQEAMKRLSRELDPHKGWADLLQEASAQHPTSEQLLPVYRKLMEKTRRFVLEKNLAPFPEHDEIRVTETPPFSQGFMPFAAYMPAPPFAKRGKGEFWVTPVSAELPKAEREARLQQHAYHKIPVIVLHETYPGHHLQFSFLRASKSPFLKRSFSSVSCEGWALYCEEMMKEEGFYDDPLTQLSQLKDQLWRAARVILDVSLQTGRLSAREATDLLVNEVKFPRAMAASEVKRYVRTPTQPMSYFIGKLEILKIRDAYRQKRKERFKLVDFHREFLKCGIAPLALAEEKILKD